MEASTACVDRKDAAFNDVTITKRFKEVNTSTATTSSLHKGKIP